MIKTSDFPKLTDDLESIFIETAESKIADSVGLQLFGVKDEVRQTHEHAILHGISGIQKVAQGNDLPSMPAQQGDSIIYTQSRYGGIISITKDMRIWDLHDDIENLCTTVTEDAFDKLDQVYADMFLGGWSTSHVDVFGETVADTTGPDSLALFSASHSYPGSAITYGNIINDGSTNNPVLARAAIVAARAAARKHKDKNNLTRPVILDTIVVGPDLEDLAYRIIKSEQMQGTPNNDTNPTGIRSINIIVWDRLASNSAGTDTSKYWFMLDSKKAKRETLKSYFSQRPQLSAPDEIYKSKNWDYSLDFYFSRGLGLPAYVFGSTGAAS